MSNPTADELEVVCAQCSFPMVNKFDPDGTFIETIFETGPATYEEAVENGWHDLGLGLFCPKCSVAHLESEVREQAEGVERGAGGNVATLLDEQVLRTFLPDVSDDTIKQFVRMFQSSRVAHLMSLAGREAPPIFVPHPKTEEQAAEFLKVTDLLPTLNEKLNQPKEIA
jgi:hypothetical protein